MPGSRSRIVSKDAYEKLSNAAFDFDVRPHKLVDAIVVLSDWERRIDKFVGFVREDRRKRVGSLSGPVSGPESGLLSGHTRSRVLSGVSRVPLGSESGPRKIEKTQKEDPRRPESGRCRVCRVRRKRGIAVTPCHRAPKRPHLCGRAEQTVKQSPRTILIRN
jgi:hypothetical protein